MPEKKLKVTVAAAQGLIKSIRLLALSGRRDFEKYLASPLADAGWQTGKNPQGARRRMQRIESESRSSSYFHTIAPKCKRLISSAIDENLSILGDSCIFFLEKMQVHAVISSSPESIEFVDVIENPVSEFQRINSGKSECRFKEAIEQISADEIKRALEPIKLDSQNEKVRLDAELKKLYGNILIASRHNNLPKCRKLLANYLIGFIDDEDYSRDEVDRLITALNKREHGFQQELNDMIAVDLYYRITKGILVGDVGSAVRWIRKYAYIFEGNPEAKHFYDIDRLERILYQLITDKNIWDQLKKN